MAEWKKVIVSGSSAELNQVTASGGFLGTLDGTASTASYVAGANVDGTVASATNATNATNATTATVATTVTITDNENTNENNPIVFVAGGDVDGGNLGLETDGDAHYNPSTGKITATSFAGNLTGDVTGNADTATTANTASYVAGANVDGTVASATTATQVGNDLTAGDGLINGGGVFNGSTARTFSVDSGSMMPFISSSIFGTINGDVTITDGGVATVTGAAVADNSITNAKLANMAANTVKVRDANSTGDPSDFVVGDTQLLIGDGTGFTAATLTGDVTMTNGGVVSLANDITIGNDLTVTGDLIVNGDTTTVNTANLNIEDKFILINSGSSTATDESGIIFGGSNGAVGAGAALIWNGDYNSNDGRLAVANAVSWNDASATVSYYVAGVFLGNETDAGNAFADHPGNIRVESSEIYIYV